MRKSGQKSQAGRERRQHKRTRVLLTGQLMSGHRSVPGLVLDVSASGARLRLSESIAFAASTALRLANCLDFPVEVVWREGTMVGLRFREEPEHIAVTLAGLLPQDCLAA